MPASWSCLNEKSKRTRTHSMHILYSFDSFCDRMFVHPNIVKFIGVCVEPIAIVTELIRGRDLWEIIHDPAVTYTYADVRKLAIGCARGMQHIHEKGQIHRDLKSLNLLVCNHSAYCCALILLVG